MKSAIRTPQDTNVCWNALSCNTGNPHTSQTSKRCVGFEVLTVVLMKISVFWDITPCSPLKDSHIPPKRRFTLSGPHGVISQEVELFMSKLLQIL
jgi:hypothetical protein